MYIWSIPSLTGLNSTKQENLLVLLCSKGAVSHAVKLEIICTVIFPHGDCFLYFALAVVLAR